VLQFTPITQRSAVSRSVLSKHLFPMRLLLSLPFFLSILDIFLWNEVCLHGFNVQYLFLFFLLTFPFLCITLLHNHYLALLCTLSIPTYASTSTSLSYLLHCDLNKSLLPFTLPFQQVLHTTYTSTSSSLPS
jgi:hypothetical protein